MTGGGILVQFGRFLSVGGFGFLLDVAVFQGLLWLGVEPVPARLVSAAMAVTLTWALNRRLVFRTSGVARRGSEYIRYVVVQAFGFSINLGVFFFLIAVNELAARIPVLAVVGGAASAIVFNYLGARYCVFRKEDNRT